MVDILWEVILRVVRVKMVVGENETLPIGRTTEKVLW